MSFSDIILLAAKVLTYSFLSTLLGYFLFSFSDNGKKKFLFALSFIFLLSGAITTVIVLFYLYFLYRVSYDSEKVHSERAHNESLKEQRQIKNEISELKEKVTSLHSICDKKASSIDRLREENDSLLKQLEESESNS